MEHQKIKTNLLRNAFPKSVLELIKMSINTINPTIRIL